MPLTDNRLTIKEAHEYLCLNGVKMTEVWFRVLIGRGAIPSKKEFNARLINRNDLAEFVRKRKLQK